jgi:hypothetical protein
MKSTIIKESSSLPSVQVGPHRIFKTAEKSLHFIDVSTISKGDFGKSLVFQSPEFNSMTGIVKSEVIGYPILDIDDELRACVSTMEKTIEEALVQFLKSSATPHLPKTLREMFISIPVLRPSFKANSDIYWAKLSPTTQYYTWEGEPTAAVSMSAGRYQFILRCNGVYLGQHGDGEYVASLNLRVAQLRHRPIELETPAYFVSKECLMGCAPTPPNTPVKFSEELSLKECPSAPEKPKKKKAKLTKQNALPRLFIPSTE